MLPSKSAAEAAEAAELDAFDANSAAKLVAAVRARELEQSQAYARTVLHAIRDAASRGLTEMNCTPEVFHAQVVLTMLLAKGFKVLNNQDPTWIVRWRDKEPSLAADSFANSPL